MVFFYYFGDSSIELQFGYNVHISQAWITKSYNWDEVKFSKLKDCNSIKEFNEKFNENLTKIRAKWKKEKKKETFKKVLDEVMGFNILKKKR